MAWVNAAGPITGNDDTANWSGYTIRLVINDAQVSNEGLGQVRVTFYSSNAQALTIDAAYIGEGAATGDVYDFGATPTQLTFDTGNAGFAIAAGANKVSDEITYSIQASKNLIVSYHVSGDSSHDDLRRGPATGWNAYYKSANEAGTVNVASYTGFTANVAVGVLRVEAQAAPISSGAGFMVFF